MFRTIRLISLSLLFFLGILFWQRSISVLMNHEGSLWVSTSYAANLSNPTNPKSAQSTAPSDYNKNLIDFINTLIKLLSLIVTPLIMLAWWLLSPDWTTGELFGFRNLLYQLWIISSNLAYLGYALLLVGSAISTMLWPEKHRFQLWGMLPHIALGILSTLFTWWIVNATLSLANVLTTSVVTLPSDMIEGGDLPMLQNEKWYTTEKVIPKEVVVDLWSLTPAEANIQQQTVQRANEAWDCTRNPDNCMSVKEFMQGFNTWPFSLLIGYAYGALKINDYKLISDGILTSLTSIGKVSVILLFAVFTYIAFAVLILILCFLLFKRAIMMWLYLAFAPFMTFAYVFSGKQMQDERVWWNITSFISLALIPVIISAALSFGFVFISIINAAVMSQTNVAANACQITYNGGTVTGVKTGFWCMGTGEVPWGSDNKTPVTASALSIGEKVRIIMLWKFIVGKDSEQKEIGVLATMLSSFLWLAVLWFAVIAAMRSTTITKKMIAPLDGLIKLTQDLPKYTPIPFMPGGSIKGMGEASAALTEASNRGLQDLARRQASNSPLIGRHLQYPLPNDPRQAFSQLKNTIRTTPDDFTSLQNMIDKIWKQGGSNALLRNYWDDMTAVFKNESNADVLRSRMAAAGLPATMYASLQRDWSNPSSLNRQDLELLWKFIGKTWDELTRYVAATNTPVAEAPTGWAWNFRVTRNGTPIDLGIAAGWTDEIVQAILSKIPNMTLAEVDSLVSSLTPNTNLHIAQIKTKLNAEITARWNP